MQALRCVRDMSVRLPSRLEEFGTENGPRIIRTARWRVKTDLRGGNSICSSAPSATAQDVRPS